MVTDTSLLSYFELKQEGKIGDRQSRILQVIREYPCLTDTEIMKVLGFEIPNMVRPRRKELLDAGLIVMVGKRKCSITKRLCMTWGIK